MFGTVSAWFYKQVAGLAPHPASVAFGRAVFRPFGAGRLRSASASVRTIRGLYAVRWHRDSDIRWSCDIAIPPYCTAEVHFPIAHPSGFEWLISERSELVRNPGAVVQASAEPGYRVVSLGSGGYAFTLTAEPQ